jgi:prepilin-type N-terminal cleavage/methylation domain-containing protein
MFAAKDKSDQLSGARGFTLIEVIAVLAVISIVVVSVVSRINFNADLQAEADKFKSQLRYVQQIGLCGNNTYTWRMDVNQNSYSFVRVAGAASVNMPLPGATGSSNNIANFATGITAGWTGSINFDQWGSPGSNTINIPLTDGSTTVTVIVTKNTGFVP